MFYRFRVVNLKLLFRKLYALFYGVINSSKCHLSDSLVGPDEGCITELPLATKSQTQSSTVLRVLSKAGDLSRYIFIAIVVRTWTSVHRGRTVKELKIHTLRSKYSKLILPKKLSYHINEFVSFFSDELNYQTILFVQNMFYANVCISFKTRFVLNQIRLKTRFVLHPISIKK